MSTFTLPLTIATHNPEGAIVADPKTFADVGRIPKGATVEYLGHVVGGAVRVRYDGREGLIDPRCTKELR